MIRGDRVLQFGEGNARVLVLDSFDGFATRKLQAPFAALLPAYSKEEVHASEGAVSDLVKRGCVEFCCVGPLAEELHDLIDAVLEDGRFFEIVTTGDTDENEACEYFVFTAAGRPAVLIGAVSGHGELVELLERMVALHQSG